MDKNSLDELDIIMSQIDSRVFQRNSSNGAIEILGEELNAIDAAMSQIDTDILYQEVEELEVDDEENIPEALMEKYEDAVNEIDDNLVEQMKLVPDIDFETSEIPDELLVEYEKALGGILPVISTNRYLHAYNDFIKWQESHGTRSFHEKVIMAYFSVKSEKYKPPTLWSMYSMLKKTLIWKHNIDLSQHCQLRAFLKTNADGYQSTKSKVFTPADLHKFFVKAPNVVYLGMKVVMIFGVVGACRGAELTNFITENVKDDGNEIEVFLPTTKNKERKYYVICGEFAKIIREYTKLRSPNTTNNRFFVQFRNGKCVNQVMGKHSIAKIPKNVAKYLQLNESEKYTGHSYRRTGTTIAADAGASLEDLKRLGPWKSSTVCEGYIQESRGYKRRLGNMITGAINLPSTSSTALADRTNTKNDSEKKATAKVEIIKSPDFEPDLPLCHVDDVNATEKVNRSEVAAVGKSLFETPKFDTPNKENIVFHFTGNVTINMK